MLLVLAHLDYGAGDIVEISGKAVHQGGVRPAGQFNCVLHARHLEAQAVVLLRKGLVAALEGEVVADGFAAAPQGAHHAVREAGHPHALQLSADRPPLLALFDRPSNRGNLGTIIRSLDALGADGLILTGHGVDLYDPDVVVSTMGSFFALPVVRVPRHDALAALFDAIREKWGDLQVLGTTAHADTALWQTDLKKPTVFMIGCETDGLSEGLKPLCTEMITIPMAETSYASSFNVACAATVMFYEAVKQRSL